MSITNYAELKTAVARWLKRDDLAEYIPDYIAFGENRLWYGDEGQFHTTPLRLRSMQFPETGVIASQSITLGSTDYPYLETQRISVTNGGNTWALRYLTPQQFAEHEARDGDPQYYTFLGEVIKTAPSNSLAYTHDYYYKPVPLSDTFVNSRILLSNPELYLFAACTEGAIDIMSDTMAARFSARLQAKINALQSNQANSMAGGSLGITIGR